VRDSRPMTPFGCDSSEGFHSRSGVAWRIAKKCPSGSVPSGRSTISNRARRVAPSSSTGRSRVRGPIALIAGDVGAKAALVDRIGHADHLDIAAPEHGAVVAGADEGALSPRLRRRQGMIAARGKLEAEAAILRGRGVEVGDGDSRVVEVEAGHLAPSPPRGASPSAERTSALTAMRSVFAAPLSGKASTKSTRRGWA